MAARRPDPMELRRRALELLQLTDPTAKAQATQALARERAQGRCTLDPAAALTPAWATSAAAPWCACTPSA